MPAKKKAPKKPVRTPSHPPSRKAKPAALDGARATALAMLKATPAGAAKTTGKKASTAPANADRQTKPATPERVKRVSPTHPNQFPGTELVPASSPAFTATAVNSHQTHGALK